MVDVPAELVLASTLCIGTIYKFSAPELIDINIPHYFIVVAIEDDNNYMVVCTTQLDNKIKYFDNLGLDFNGLVYIKPDNTNGLTKDSYVNCNQYHTITRQELIIKIESEVFECTGGNNH